ncbi:hypothetical protein CONLIGDRAFT_636632 [Coniochaeta ligniaria NRRL 30616]|uniref:Uncharacterized protein n=1 Tax=Coniochaeta ligniaria NRRL 30616 TaxID=1408157 RepID=A0A1J7J5M7_9PEZI|nr:hypothetical protein CONLIGDRAFT_636632 [Coniochaeta ligniaria NRRL 30616]
MSTLRRYCATFLLLESWIMICYPIAWHFVAYMSSSGQQERTTDDEKHSAHPHGIVLVASGLPASQVSVDIPSGDCLEVGNQYNTLSTAI